MTGDDPARPSPPPGDSPAVGDDALYRTLINALPDLTVFVFGFDLRHTAASGLAFERLGWDLAVIVGRRPSELLTDGGGAELEEHMRAALAGETRVFDHAGLRDTTGFWRSTVVPVRDSSGSVVAGMIVSRDIGPVREAQRGRLASDERFEAALEAMLDSVTVQEPVYDEAGDVVDFRITFATEDAVDFAGRGRSGLVGRTLRELFPELGNDFIATYAWVLHSGEGVHFNAFPYPAADGRELLYDLAVTRLGDVLVVTWREVTEREANRALVARTTAVRSVSEALQRGLLPPEPPDLRGVRFAATYHPALETAEVGGDWYDVVRPPDDTAGDVVDVIVGDVEGHDGQAAALMARYSTLVRAASCRCETVEAIVGELREFHATLAVERLVTLAVARLDLTSGAVTVLAAGHPPPVVRRASSDVDIMDISVDPPVGAPGECGGVSRLFLEPGATLVMFSDGLLDPHADPDDSYAEITSIVAGIDGDDLDELVAALASYARGHQPSDDVVIVAAHRPSDLRS